MNRENNNRVGGKTTLPIHPPVTILEVSVEHSRVATLSHTTSKGWKDQNVTK